MKYLLLFDLFKEFQGNNFHLNFSIQWSNYINKAKILEAPPEYNEAIWEQVR